MQSVSPPRDVRAPDTLLRHGPGTAVLRMGAPLALGLASHVLVNLVDLLLVGRLGAEAVQAAHVASAWNFLPMILGNCVSTALLARLSRLSGQGELLAARQLHHRAEWFMLWCGLVTGIASALPATMMVAATGLEGPTADAAVHYLVVANLGCLPMFVLMQATAAMRAAGEVAVPLGLLVLANVLNLLLDLVLLFGWDALGVPAIGVTGAAYASVVSRTAAAILALAWLRRRRHSLSLRDVPPAPRLRVAVPLLHDAWPQIVQIALRAGLVIGLTVVVQRQYGDQATAAFGIATRLDTLILFASLGFANAATVYAGRAVVTGQWARARAAGLWAGVQAAMFGVGVVLLLQHYSAAVVELFLPGASAEIVAIADLYFRTGLWSQVLSAAALGAIGAVHGAGRMVAPMVLDLIGFTAAMLLLVASASRGLEAVCFALAGGMACVAVLHFGFVALGRWVRPV